MSETIFQRTYHDEIAAQFAAEQDIIVQNGGPGYGCTRRADRIAVLLHRLNGGEGASFLTFRAAQPGAMLRHKGYRWREHTVCINIEEEVDGGQLTIVYDPVLDNPYPIDDYAAHMFRDQEVVYVPKSL